MLKEIIEKKDFEKLQKLKNPKIINIIEKFVKLCKPSTVVVLDDSKKDIDYIRKLTIKKGEEEPLKMKGHTIHYDNYYDQARDTKNTKILLARGKRLSKHIQTIDKEEGLKEIFEIMRGMMKGKEMFVCFYCLGPTSSRFSIPALQLTDSAYVVHSENLLFRQGYKEFKKLKGSPEFFYFIHSAGEIDENNTCRNLNKRRIYIDLEEERVITVNNQYGGNSIGLKKLALRLAISKADREDWLSEHMFIAGIHPEGKKRVTYFAGAFPSICGKTSTAMMPGQTIVGDDIAYLRINRKGQCIAANVECGIFGIIENVNPRDDPVIYRALTTPREVVFSNVLKVGNVPYWLGMGKEIPKKGFNHSGEWSDGKTDKDGRLIDPSHKNARFTLVLKDLENVDPKANDPDGVRLRGIIYGGRDSDTSVPVLQSLSWPHGVFIGTAIESKTTAAKLGTEGVLSHDPMANMDFLVIPLGTYIKNHLKFGEKLDYPPAIFATNYFLKENGNGHFLNSKLDKKVWLLWMEGRVHNEFEVIETPIGFIPKYDDLRTLFRKVLDKNYSKEDYIKQFSIRIEKLLRKLDRIEKIYNEEEGVPGIFNQHLAQQKKRLLAARKKFGKDVISPFEFV